MATPSPSTSTSTSSSTSSSPLRLAVLTSATLVAHELMAALEPYADRVRLVHWSTRLDLLEPADLTVVDTFARSEVLPRLVRRPGTGPVVVRSWNTHRSRVEAALRHGAAGYVGKDVAVPELVDCLERVHGGEVVVTGTGSLGRSVAGAVGRATRDVRPPVSALTPREAEVLSLISPPSSAAR